MQRKRGRAGFVNSLIETEAVVDEEEEEEEEDGEYDSDRGKVSAHVFFQRLLTSEQMRMRSLKG